MNKIARKYIALFVVCVMALQLISCGVTNHNADQATAVQGTVIEIEKYGHAVLNIQTAEFVASGYELGDVVRVRLGTFEATMPFFDGYYSNPGQLMLRGSAEEDNIAVCINYGDFCGENQVKVGDTVEITLADMANNDSRSI